jgi:hypothetical protein
MSTAASARRSRCVRHRTDHGRPVVARKQAMIRRPRHLDGLWPAARAPLRAAGLAPESRPRAAPPLVGCGETNDRRLPVLDIQRCEVVPVLKAM